MGRAKLKLEFITKERSRMLTFKKRKQGLLRKLQELTTLCDVKACIIIYGPKQEHGAIEPEIWPQNPEEVRRIIGLYEGKNRGCPSSSLGNARSSFGLSDFFNDRKKKIEEEIVKLRKKNMEAKYPTRIELLSFLTEGELREFGAALKNKAEIVKSRIAFLKRNRQIFDMNQSHDFRAFYDSTAAIGDYTICGKNPMAVPQYYAPPQIVQPLPPLYTQCFGMGAMVPPLYYQCGWMDGLTPPFYVDYAGMGGVAPPQLQCPASMENCENDDGGLEDILSQYI